MTIEDIRRDLQRRGYANGYEPAEPMFNTYHVSPHETQDPDEFVTEICYPVKKK